MKLGILTALTAILIVWVLLRRFLRPFRRARIRRSLALELASEHERLLPTPQRLLELQSELDGYGLRWLEPVYWLPGYGFVVIGVHTEEASLVLVGAPPHGPQRAGPPERVHIHALTALTGDRRVELSTVIDLWELPLPSGVVRVDLEDRGWGLGEVWSQHRRKLLDYPRGERLPLPDDPLDLIRISYLDWIQSGIRAQRLSLDKDPDWLQVHAEGG